MRPENTTAPLIDERLQEAFKRFRELERTLRVERETIGREMIALKAGRSASGQASTPPSKRAPVEQSRHEAPAPRNVHTPVAPKAAALRQAGAAGGSGASSGGAPHIVIARWGDQYCSHCGAVLSVEQASRRRCHRCGSQLRFDRAAAPNSPTKAFPCPACGKVLVGVGPGQLCYHCGHRLSRTVLSELRRRENEG